MLMVRIATTFTECKSVKKVICMAGNDNDCHNTNYMFIQAILESLVANNIRYLYLVEEIMRTLYNRSE